MTNPDNLPDRAKLPLPAPGSPEASGTPRMGLKLTKGSAVDVLGIDPIGDWSNILGATRAPELLDGLILQLAALGERGRHVSEAASNQALAFVSEMKPRDPAELLLLTQMAAIHQATMTQAGRLNRVEMLPQQDSAERALNKLARTFAAQMETLKRYRSKGHQTVRVERVTVESGGQAVVGNVQTGGRGGDEG